MNFYKHFYCIMTFLALHLNGTSCIDNHNLDVMRVGVETLAPCSVGLVLFADVNNTLDDVDFDVELTPDQCCLDIGSEDVCNVVQIEGECVGSIDKGSSRTLRLIAPLLEPFGRRGYCIVFLDSKPRARQGKSMRNTIKIPFDTRIKSTKLTRQLFGNISTCNEVDEDPLNDCKPVDCETYYNGERSYFDEKTRRCVDIPYCLSNSANEVPNKIYDKKKNKCVEGESITDRDLGLIKQLTSSAKERVTKDILILKKIKVPTKTLVTTVNHFDLDKNISKMLREDESKNYVFKFKKLHDLKKKGFMFWLTHQIVGYWSTLYMLAAVVLCQCCLICLMLLCISNNCGCSNKKTIRQIFNYHHDASVTTPLICTSNIDTETTEFQYFSETSNIDKKIKCYKACQKERKNNAKMSMSDDILSKCITRRDWNSKPARSVAIAESQHSDDGNTREVSKKDTADTERPTSILNQTNISEQNKKPSNVKVNFENEQDSKQKKEKKRSNNTVETVKKKSENKHKVKNRDYDDLQCESEKEIKCHSYKYLEGSSNITGFKKNSSKKLGFFKSDKNKTGALTESTEKGAQAAFSNDSLDDFLSERGVLFLTGDDLSKYSFTSQSNDAKGSSLSSVVSSKTSKNNVVKNVLSLIARKCTGPSSDPGSKKKESKPNMELIHMSTASVYSSNNESEYLKSLRQTKDSRTSL